MKEQLIKRELNKTSYETSVGLVEGPMMRVAGKLKEKFESGYFQLLLGDDVSGRFPTLALGEYARRLAEKHRQPLPTVWHIKVEKHGYPSAENIKLPEVLGSIEVQQITTALIVTEYINEGGTINAIETGLANIGVATEVATLEYSAPGFSFNGNLYSGREYGAGRNYEPILKLRDFTHRLYGRGLDGDWIFPHTQDEQKKAGYQAALRDVDRLVNMMLSTV